MSGIDVMSLMNKFPNEPFEILQGLGGFYRCPKDDAGNRLGPLVGYAGKDEQGRQFVGDIYANFAKAEEWPTVLHYWTYKLQSLIANADLHFDVCCGAPMGGIVFAAFLAFVEECRLVFMEKKVTAVATESAREKSVLEFVRHEVYPGEAAIITEDVTNNFSTTEAMCEKIELAGGMPVGIVSMLNRSNPTQESFDFKGSSIPVISLVTQPIDQYRQDDPEVIADIQAGNVVWKPKNEWDRLMEAMAQKP